MGGTPGETRGQRSGVVRASYNRDKGDEGEFALMSLETGGSSIQAGLNRRRTSQGRNVGTSIGGGALLAPGSAFGDTINSGRDDAAEECQHACRDWVDDEDPEETES